MSATIKVLLADDQALVRGALAALLALEPDLEVVAEVGRATRWSTPRGSRRRRVPARHRDAGHRRHRRRCRGARPATRRAHPRRDDLRPARLPAPGARGGRSGFVVKDTPARQLADAVRRVHAGLRVVDPSLATESLLDGANPLTEREREVLRSR